jgi:uncharacterized protein YegL
MPPRPHDKRLPVYLLLDCSGSMSGEPVAAMSMGLNGFLGEIGDDPHATETVWLSVITFGSVADQAVPLVQVDRFNVPRFEAAGSSALGEALQLLLDRIDDEVGYGDEDWQPIAFVFTDGAPTDPWREVLDKIRRENRVHLVACGIGSNVNETNLRKLSDTVLHLSNSPPGTLVSCLRWTHSQMNR